MAVQYAYIYPSQKGSVCGNDTQPADYALISDLGVQNLFWALPCSRRIYQVPMKGTLTVFISLRYSDEITRVLK
jgi:hypothetical protein